MQEAEQKAPDVVRLANREIRILSVCLFLYYSLMVVCLLPSGPFKQRCQTAFGSFVAAVGLGQPSPQFGQPIRNFNGHIIADIQFADGSTRPYELPRDEELDMIEAYLHCRMGRLVDERLLNTPDSDPLLISLARGIARANIDKDNQPSLITLILKWSPLPPTKEGSCPDRDSFPLHVKTHPMLVYRVRSADI
jgi:hypothetical protein